MTCNYSKRQLENGPVSISCTVITFLTAELLPKLEVLGFKCCRLYITPGDRAPPAPTRAPGTSPGSGRFQRPQYRMGM